MLQLFFKVSLVSVSWVDKSTFFIGIKQLSSGKFGYKFYEDCFLIYTFIAFSGKRCSANQNWINLRAFELNAMPFFFIKIM